MDRPEPELGTQDETLRKRVLAVIIDAVLIAVITFAITSALGDVTNVFGSVIGGVGLLSFAYFIYFEAVYGQTLGKNVMDIVVVKADGGDCDWRASIIRNVFRVIDGFAFYLVGFIVIILTDDDQRLGDIVGDTVVMKVAPTAVDSPS